MTEPAGSPGWPCSPPSPDHFHGGGADPGPHPHPGVKLGLANIVTVYAVFALGPGTRCSFW